MDRLADAKKVDTFFCQSNDSTVHTQRALKLSYDTLCGGKGFGTISLQTQGVQSFRAQVLANLTQAVAGSLAEKDIAGMQTADGVSVSSLAGSLQASIREGLAELGCVLDDDDGEEKKEMTAETDWQRLQRELQLEALHPVRLLLGVQMPQVDTLLASAAQVLWQAGLQIEQQLQAKGYPEPIQQAYLAFLKSKMDTL